MRHASGILLAVVLAPFMALVFAVPVQPANMAFRVHLIDSIESETAAVADLNNDHRPDIISAESWYEAPNWTKHPLRAINRASG